MPETNPLANRCTCELRHDISLALGVQQLLFPRSSPSCDWCCIGVKNNMAQGLGGDYFDFIETADGTQVLFLGDVTGHGLHASVVMSLIYGFIHRAALDCCPPRDTVDSINRFLRSFASRTRKLDHLFSTTLFLAVIDPIKLKMDYINCGHVAPLIRRGDRLSRLTSTAPPLGFFAEPEISQGRFKFDPGDRLLLHTDGINEATNESDEQFGDANIEAALLEFEGDHLELLDALFAKMVDFGCTNPPRDDCTAIVLDFHRPSAMIES